MPAPVKRRQRRVHLDDIYPRGKFTYDQVAELWALFVRRRYPTVIQRRRLGNHVGLNPDQVDEWFTNTRVRPHKPYILQVKRTSPKKPHLQSSAKQPAPAPDPVPTQVEETEHPDQVVFLESVHMELPVPHDPEWLTVPCISPSRSACYPDWPDTMPALPAGVNGAVLA